MGRFFSWCWELIGVLSCCTLRPVPASAGACRLQGNPLAVVHARAGGPGEEPSVEQRETEGRGRTDGDERRGSGEQPAGRDPRTSGARDQRGGEDDDARQGSGGVPAVLVPRVLLVDDHERMRWAVRQLLEASGMEVVGELGDGTDVADAVRRLRPDVVVTDLVMPRVGGVEAMRRARVADPGVRLVVFSAAVPSSGPGSAELDMAGVSALLPKGVMPDVLVTAVARAARERRPPAG